MFVSGLKMLQYMTGGIAIQAYLEVIFRQSSSISGPLVSIIYGFVQLITGKLIYKNLIFLNEYICLQVVPEIDVKQCRGWVVGPVPSYQYFFLMKQL